jgi:pteridine reductase
MSMAPPSAPPPSIRRPRRVLVVGATGRLGVRIARALRSRGDRVILAARDGAKLSAMAAELGGDDGAKTVCVDLMMRDAPDQVANQVRGHGGIDDIVLACGPFPRTPFDGLRREDLERTLTVHAVVPLLLVGALSSELTASRGAVIALGDAGVTRPYENHVAYLTAKGALQTGLRALAVELAPNVRINMVALGIVADPEADGDPLRTHRLAARSPLGRFGTADEVSHVVLALLDATWATGEIWGIGR